MAWQGKLLHDGHANDLMDLIGREFDGLNDMEALSAKVATTDAKHEPAFAFLFFNEDHQDRELPKRPPKGNWTQITITANDHAGFTRIIHRVEQKLNELESDSFAQAFFAKFIACNAKHEQGYFTLLIPPK